MNANEALRQVEQKVVARRTIANRAHLFEQYEKQVLPSSMATRDVALVDQGYAAGFDAAMQQVTQVLNEVQSAALAAERN